jgi:hypothetical protein
MGTSSSHCEDPEETEAIFESFAERRQDAIPKLKRLCFVYAGYRPKLRNLGEVGTVLFQISRRDEIVSLEMRQLTYNSPALLR